MILIVDTNIVFSALLKESETRKLLIESPWILYAPTTLVEEIMKYKTEILRRSGLSEKEFSCLFALLLESVNVVEKERYNTYLDEAKKLLGTEHSGDIPFLALALSMQNDGIWTEDIDFEKQQKVKIWKTKELLRLIKP